MVRKTGRAVTIIGLFITACCMARAQTPGEESAVPLRIHAPTIVAALIQFSQQTGFQLVLPTDNASVQRSPPALDGRYTARAALEELLRDSGLTFSFVNARTISVSLTKAASSNPGDPAATPANR